MLSGRAAADESMLTGESKLVAKVRTPNCFGWCTEVCSCFCVCVSVFVCACVRACVCARVCGHALGPGARARMVLVMYMLPSLYARMLWGRICFKRLLVGAWACLVERMGCLRL